MTVHAIYDDNDKDDKDEVNDDDEDDDDDDGNNNNDDDHMMIIVAMMFDVYRVACLSSTSTSQDIHTYVSCLVMSYPPYHIIYIAVGASYIRRLIKPTISSDRYYYEHWLGEI